MKRGLPEASGAERAVWIFDARLVSVFEEFSIATDHLQDFLFHGPVVRERLQNSPFGACRIDAVASRRVLEHDGIDCRSERLHQVRSQRPGIRARGVSKAESRVEA